MNLVEEYFTAGKCYLREAVSLKKLVGFSQMSLAAVEYINENIGAGDISEKQKLCLISALKLGVIINDYWDEGGFSKEEYRKRRTFIQKNGLSSDYICYYRDITNTERERPNPQQAKPEDVFRYREQMNAISLGGVCAMTGMGSYTSFVGEDKLIARDAEIWFKNLWNIIMALQVIDDQVGWVGDTNSKRPSFYTALAMGSKLQPEEINKELKAKWKDYLNQVGADGENSGMEPLVLAVGLIGIVLPLTYSILRQIPAGNKLMKGREKKEG